LPSFEDGAEEEVLFLIAFASCMANGMTLNAVF
jgi:hypothetical protein